VGVHPLLGLLQGVLDGLFIVVVELVGQLLGVLDGVPHGVDVAVQGVLGVDSLLGDLVLLRELLGVPQHLLDLLLRQPTLVVGDGDLVLDVGTLIVGGDGQDGVGVDLEGDLDLGLSSGGLGEPGEVELTEDVVVLGHGSLSLEDLDGHGLLVVLVGGEDLTLLGGDEGTSGDDGGHHTSDGLDTEREGGGVDDDEILTLSEGLSTDDTSLHGGAVGDGLIGVDTGVGLLPVEEVLHELSDLGDTGGTSDQHDLVDLGLLESGVGEGVGHGSEGLLEQVGVEFLESGPGEVLIQGQSFL